VSTRDVLRERLNPSRASTEREALQELGRRLDHETGGRWISDAVVPVAEGPHRLVIVDAVRIAEQLNHLRESLQVVHIHLTAPMEVLSARYENMRRWLLQGQEVTSYALIMADPTEAQVDTLAELADSVIDTAANTADATHAAAVAVVDRLVT
jgi:adenylosuccinate synthase